MTKLEFCKAVLAYFGNWPFSGALGAAASLYDKKQTVEQAIAALTIEAAKKRAKHRAH